MAVSEKAVCNEDVRMQVVYRQVVRIFVTLIEKQKMISD